VNMIQLEVFFVFSLVTGPLDDAACCKGASSVLASVHETPLANGLTLGAVEENTL